MLKFIVRQLTKETQDSVLYELPPVDVQFLTPKTTRKKYNRTGHFKTLLTSGPAGQLLYLALSKLAVFHLAKSQNRYGIVSTTIPEKMCTCRFLKHCK